MPTNLQRLVASGHLNGLNVEAQEVALGDQAGSIPVTREKGFGASSGNAVVGEAGLGGGVTTVVPLTTLDCLAEERGWSRIDTIKVDIEGYEVPFMRGAAALLTRDRPVIVGEFNSDMMPKFGHTFLDVGEICARMEYRIVAFEHDGRPIEVRARIGLGNVVLVPEERFEATMRRLSLCGMPADPMAG